ncbi:MAG: Stk1 family PASTA domain-containing Ser/Thr kinase [Ruminococcus sp.]|nr:Stk1 family PASTA domain-containing Ser/Thr kinase [Ruminococcus sp.]
MDKNIGKKLDGRYEITELIGVGGMAEVYKGIDVIDNKTVAIKILKKEYAENEEFLRRFRNESKAIAVLSHPNIVKIYDVGFSEKIQYIVMEYIDGITLKEYIEEEKVLTWKDTVHFVIQILRALQHAHDKGIVHRDIKPQNIMMFTDGTIKVMDFGIAKFAREEGKTATDQAIGSVHYISPEQASGNVTDAKSDIYSVGAMMYEMLTGKKPFDSDNPVAIAVMHMHDIPERPRAINPEIPDGLEEIVLKAMEKAPEDRYQTTGEMINDIEAFKSNPEMKFGYYQEEEDSIEDTRHFSAHMDNAQHEEPMGQEQNVHAYAGAGMGAAGAPGYQNPQAAQQRFAQQPQQPPYNNNYYEDEDDDDEEEERSSLVVPVLTAVIVVVIIVAVIFIASLLSGLLKNSGKKNDFKMEDFIGMDYTEANNKYGNNINFEVVDSEYAEYPENAIIWQSIPEGQEFNKGDTLKVKLSKGMESTEVPKCTEMNQEMAKDQLNIRGLKFEIKQQPDANVEKGYVIKTEPKEGTVVHKGSKVILYVSMGPNKAQIEVKDFVDMDAKDAAEVASYSGLKVKTETGPSYKEKGKVYEQSIAKGEKVDEGTEIILYVSDGTDPDGEIPYKITFPDGAKGRFVIDYIVQGKDGARPKTESSTTIILPGYSDYEQVVGGSGEDVLVTIMLTNLNNNSTATLGTYKFNFATGSVNTLTEDVYSAFQQVGGFPEPETEPYVEPEPEPEPTPNEYGPEPTTQAPPPPAPTADPSWQPGFNGEYVNGVWTPYEAGVNGDWIFDESDGQTKWQWY